MEANMRKVPQQPRSQQRVEQILDVAAELFVEVGYEAATTNAIAERAGISIGSLYRYFPDKVAILNAIARRYFGDLQALLDQLSGAEAQVLSLDDLLDGWIDPFVGLHREFPVYNQILLGRDISPDLAGVACQLTATLERRFKELLLARNPQLEPLRAEVLASVCFGAIKLLIILFAQAPDEDYGMRLVAEVKNMLRSYLTSIAV